MLYEVHELSRAAALQARIMVGAQSYFFRHPFNPLSHTMGGRSIASACDVFEDLARRYRKPSFDLTQTRCDGATVTLSERVVKRKSFGQLKHFKRGVARPHDPKLLIVAPLSGHYSTLLRGTVEALVPAHDVYITDWRDARRVPLAAGDFGLDDYTDYIVDFLDYLGPDTHVLAVCQPAVPVLAATALMADSGHPASPRSIALMSGPIDTRICPTSPDLLATTHSLSWFRRHMIHTVPATYAGFMRQVYPGFMQLGGFMSMNPERHVDAYWRMFLSMVDEDHEQTERLRKFYDEYRAVMDLPAKFYLDTIERVFQQHYLARNRFRHRGHKVDPAAVSKTALLTIEGENDDITGTGQTRAAHALCPNIPATRRDHLLQSGVGHYGVFNGRRWRNEIAPYLTRFIRANS